MQSYSTPCIQAKDVQLTSYSALWPNRKVASVCVWSLDLLSVLRNDKHILLPCDELFFQFCVGPTGDFVAGITEALESSLVDFLWSQGKDSQWQLAISTYAGSCSCFIKIVHDHAATCIRYMYIAVEYHCRSEQLYTYCKSWNLCVHLSSANSCEHELYHTFFCIPVQISFSEVCVWFTPKVDEE